jgi:hypothetical protein
MSQYFDDYNYYKNNYDDNSQFTEDKQMSELSEVQKYDIESEDSDTKIYKFTNNYSIGGTACVVLIIIIILLYIYFNYWRKA